MSNNPKRVQITAFFCSGQPCNQTSELDIAEEFTDPSDIDLYANTISTEIKSPGTTSNEEIDFTQPNQRQEISSIPPKRTKTQNVYFQKAGLKSIHGFTTYRV
ncbi:hypothetical protein LOD99_3943 [Oopsacas minuta]|uniref:Uncharacterized protein n=1 Tax=Oopsacas minuta TaxID=111878 RepID=A0AAV7JW86_9METZ|nr:hypothetical protein LOD99_3943 [Oopsacas minuta]